LQEDEALEALRLVAAALATAKLRHLNLSDNALGEKGVRAAAAALQPVSSTWCQTATACTRREATQCCYTTLYTAVGDCQGHDTPASSCAACLFACFLCCLCLATHMYLQSCIVVNTR
jgi:hypothetical protein